MMASPVLCAVDFSADSEAALLWAARQAELENARLVVLHVVHDPASSPGFYRKPGDDDWLRPMEDVAKTMFAEFLAKARKSNPEITGLRKIETMLVTGLPPGRICDVADEIAAALVVVGSRGRSGLPHVLLGSVAERVAQTADAPVTIVKAKDSAQ
jgi:nucleotide-binding universal stress UspA family protein